MRNSIKKSGVLFCFFVVLHLNVFCQTSLVVNVGAEISDVSYNPTGFNSCWFMDDDEGFPDRAISEASLNNLNAGSFRFPYGNLGDNYLWTWPLENNPSTLNLRTAASHLSLTNYQLLGSLTKYLITIIELNAY